MRKTAKISPFQAFANKHNQDLKSYIWTVNEFECYFRKRWVSGKSMDFGAKVWKLQHWNPGTQTEIEQMWSFFRDLTQHDRVLENTNEILEVKVSKNSQNWLNIVILEKYTQLKQFWVITDKVQIFETLLILLLSHCTLILCMTCVA